MPENGERFNNIIFVNNPAATSGGALTVLLQFLESIAKYDRENLYYVFCVAPEAKKFESGNVRIVSDIYRRKWIGRLFWDNFGMERWAKAHDIRPKLVISLQNTGVRLGRKIDQIVYYHQSLPMYDYRWSPLRKEERILWIYKNIYPWFVKRHFYSRDMLVVQADWMKEAAHRVLKIPSSRIAVVKTTLKTESLEKAQGSRLHASDKFRIIYPATNMIYKNHEVIYRALEIIKERSDGIYENLEFCITLNRNDVPQESKTSLASCLVFMENLKYEELLERYAEMDLLVFPSYLETVGLPLLEAAYYGLPIAASDLPYAREALTDYPGAGFINFEDPEAWATAIIFAYENRKKYDKILSDQRDTWQDMFQLIEQQLVQRR